MAQRTEARAFYNEGVWKRRDARYHQPDQRPRHDQRHKGTDHLPQPRFQGWTRDNWFDAHVYRHGHPHTGPRCACQNAETALWRRLQTAGFLRPTRGPGDHAQSGDED